MVTICIVLCGIVAFLILLELCLNEIVVGLVVLCAGVLLALALGEGIPILATLTMPVYAAHRAYKKQWKEARQFFLFAVAGFAVLILQVLWETR